MTTDNSLARCPHFGDCGGCKNQDVPYEDQVAAKSEALGELFADFWTDPIPVAPSPDLWHYRNKIDPAFARMRYPEPPPADFVRETVLGYKKKGQWYWPLDIDECHIGPEGASALFQATRAWYQEKSIRAWDNRSKDGILRYLLVRDGKRSGKKMVVLITHEGELDCAPFVELAQSVYGATSIYRGIFTGRSDVATAERLELLAGDPHITETLHVPDGDGGMRSLDFRISPLSFFQTNPMATEHLYGAIRAHVRKLTPPSLYDLYGGAGGIAFSCSDLVEKIWSVEEVEPATEDGRHNAEVNGITNVEFITAKTEKYLVEQRVQGGLADGATVILDPPRSALHPKAIKRLMEFQPENIIYVSCNPKLLARELAIFSEVYDLASLEAFDLFPHTPHVEALAVLKKR
jgi:23S rRNA (uracil-5-)-methyltransferase RumA